MTKNFELSCFNFHGTLLSMIPRTALEQRIRRALRRSRVVALIGPRQAGKTTLARQFADIRSRNYFDLEDSDQLARLDEPKTALAPLKGLVVIDEIQRKPDLFPLLRVLADRRPLPAKFLILGSAGSSLLKQSSESLAGRIETVSIGGLALQEIGGRHLQTHWLRGGFPPAYLAGSDADSLAWRKQFTQTFLERDIPQMGFRIPAHTLKRFWSLLAHYHGQLWNAAEPSVSLGVSPPTVRHYLDVLEGTLMIRTLMPWHENLGKRQIKSPKVYFRDSGILHLLLGIRTFRDLESHPKQGASWEGYVLEELLKSRPEAEPYFWRTHNGAELDLLLLEGGKRLGVEIKYSDAPRLTPSMRIAVKALKLHHLTVVYPGDRAYPLADRIEVVPAQQMLGR